MTGSADTPCGSVFKVYMEALSLMDSRKTAMQNTPTNPYESL